MRGEYGLRRSRTVSPSAEPLQDLHHRPELDSRLVDDHVLVRLGPFAQRPLRHGRRRHGARPFTSKAERWRNEVRLEQARHPSVAVVPAPFPTSLWSVVLLSLGVLYPAVLLPRSLGP